MGRIVSNRTGALFRATLMRPQIAGQARIAFAIKIIGFFAAHKPR
jgi:hypothetical protein